MIPPQRVDLNARRSGLLPGIELADNIIPGRFPSAPAPCAAALTDTVTMRVCFFSTGYNLGGGAEQCQALIVAHLLRTGLLMKTRQGRCLTPHGQSLSGIQPPENEQGALPL